MTDINLLFKALKLSWVSRLLPFDERSWCTISSFFFQKMGETNFRLRCNYGTTYFHNLPDFVLENDSSSQETINHVCCLFIDHKNDEKIAWAGYLAICTHAVSSRLISTELH